MGSSSGSSRSRWRRLDRWHPWVPPVLVVVAVVLWFAWRPGYEALAFEDGVIEWLTFMVYVAAAVLSVVVARLLVRRGLRVEAILYVAVALAFLVIAGEEISWGQRQLGFDGPDVLVERNLQGEANVHNLLGRYVLHGVYIAVGLLGAVGARWLAPRLPRLRERPWLFAPGRRLAPWFLAVVVYYVWVDYVDWVAVRVVGDAARLGQINRLQEPPEFLLACGFLFFVAAVWRRLAGRDRVPPAGTTARTQAVTSGAVRAP